MCALTDSSNNKDYCTCSSKKTGLPKGKSEPKLNVTQSAIDLTENVSFQILSQVWLHVFEATGGFEGCWKIGFYGIDKHLH